MPAMPVRVTSAETIGGEPSPWQSTDVADDHAVVLHETPSRRPLGVPSAMPKLKPATETMATRVRARLNTPR